MDPTTAHQLIHDVGDLRHRVRHDRRAASTPLIVFGGMTLLEALLLYFEPLSVSWVALDLLIRLVAAPAGFVLVALAYRRRQVVTGVGGRTGPYVIAALVVFPLYPVALLFGPYPEVGVALTVIAWQQRNLYLAVWAVIFGLIGSLEALHVISNRLYGAADALGLFRAQD
ncbi:MAG TPA: hypothetical protein VIJ09_12580, partial [Acidimicrobiales bacterium]